MAQEHKSIPMLSLLEKPEDDTNGKKEKTKREFQKAAFCVLPKYPSVSLVPS